MKRRVVMVLATVVGIFAVENAADILISTYAPGFREIFVWAAIAVVCAFVVYEVGEDRGDW